MNRTIAEGEWQMLRNKTMNIKILLEDGKTVKAWEECDSLLHWFRAIALRTDKPRRSRSKRKVNR